MASTLPHYCWSFVQSVFRLHSKEQMSKTSWKVQEILLQKVNHDTMFRLLTATILPFIPVRQASWLSKELT